MPSNTGAPKLTPPRAVEYLHSLEDTEVQAIIDDKDYSEHYRSLAKEEKRLRALLG